MCLVESCEDDGTDVDASADWSMAISSGGNYVSWQTINIPLLSWSGDGCLKTFLQSSGTYYTLTTDSKAAVVQSTATDEEVLFFGALYKLSGRRKRSRPYYK